MSSMMTGETESQRVVNIVSLSGMGRPRLKMMRIERSATLTTILTSIAISSKDILTKLAIFGRRHFQGLEACFSAQPIRMIGTNEMGVARWFDARLPYPARNCSLVIIRELSSPERPGYVFALRFRCLSAKSSGLALSAFRDLGACLGRLSGIFFAIAPVLAAMNRAKEASSASVGLLTILANARMMPGGHSRC